MKTTSLLETIFAQTNIHLFTHSEMFSNIGCVGLFGGRGEMQVFVTRPTKPASVAQGLF